MVVREGVAQRISVFVVESLWRQPARIVAVSFFAVALIGALLLMLPMSLAPGHSLSFLDAFFTATSAVCVTGLIVVDTPVHFSTFGHIVILALIQIGGLGIMAFSLAAVFLTRKRLSIGESELLSFMLNEEDRTSLRSQLGSVIVITLLIEVIGTVLLYPMMRAAESEFPPLWLALFHAISAFCNAGFSLFSDSLVQFADSLAVNLVIGGLIVAGGIGFMTLTVFRDDIHAFYRYIVPGKSASITARVFRPQLSLRYIRSESSRMALIGTGLLLLSGWILFYLLESGGVMRSAPLGSKYLYSFFQSVTLRTAGFNTVDISALGRATLLVTLPFMFVGAASGGTAGGIKIGTVGVIIADMHRFFTGRDNAVLFYRRIPRRTIGQAYILAFGGTIIVLLAAILLTLLESAPVEVILFEIVSALGTVGLSAGLTPELTALGRIVIIVLMFAGRLGPLTLVTAFRPRVVDEVVQYPDGTIPVG